MTRRADNLAANHPAGDDLDRWRAGLIDAASPEGQALWAHLEHCHQCVEGTELWRQVREALDTREPRLALPLRTRRERALRGVPAGRRGHGPWLAALAAVLAGLAVGIGTFLYYEKEPPVPLIAKAPVEGDSDLYADLDFYLWLLERQSESDQPNG